MMRETPDVIRRFAAFYRAAGAERILVYYDGALDDRGGMVPDDVVLTECTAEFWKETCVVGRPDHLEAAQGKVYSHAARTNTSDWLLVVDADEFLVGGSIRSMLSRVPDEIEALRIRNVEAAWGPGDDITRPFASTDFRKPLPKKLFALLSWPLYGGLTPFFHRGLVGHSEGKHFVRREARGCEIQCHDSFRDGRRLGRWAHDVVSGAERMVVLHFDAISFERWREKWRRRFSGEAPANMMSPKRAAQLHRVEAAVTAGKMEALQLFRAFYGLTPWQRAILSLVGRIERHRDIFPADRDQGT